MNTAFSKTFSYYLGQIILLVFAGMSVEINCVPAQSAPQYLSNSERSKIANIVLGKTSLAVDSVNDKSHIYLSRTNLPVGFVVRKLSQSDVEIKLINLKEINSGTTAKFVYYEFEPLNVRKNSVEVTLLRMTIESPGYGSTTGTSYRCKKSNRTWKCSVMRLILRET